MSLYIGVTTASTELTDSPVNTAITVLAASVAMKTRQGLIPGGPSLDVTFMLPGKREKPAFAGMRMGGYTPEGGTLYFEAAVPEHILNSNQAGHYVAMVMQDVVTHAGAFFQENATAFDVPLWRRVMDQVTEADAGARASR
jgi:hypothetical protein